MQNCQNTLCNLQNACQGLCHFVLAAVVPSACKRRLSKRVLIPSRSPMHACFVALAESICRFEKRGSRNPHATTATPTMLRPRTQTEFVFGPRTPQSGNQHPKNPLHFPPCPNSLSLPRFKEQDATHAGSNCKSTSLQSNEASEFAEVSRQTCLKP